MKKKMINREHIEGRVYDHKLALKVTGENSKNPGTEYINGTLDVVTDDAGLNVVTVNFTYVTATTSKGTKNETFDALKSIIDNNKTVVALGADSAAMVKIDTALGLNDFYTNRDGEEKLVSAKRNDGGFVHLVNKLCDEKDRNNFEFDVLISGTRHVDADPERHIDNDYVIVQGNVFNFRNAILPVELVVKNDGGMKYFESLDTPVFTRVWGKIESQTIVTTKEEESAFGESSVKEYTRSLKEWVITGAAKEPYDIEDPEQGISAEEFNKAKADREVYLAEIKKRQDEYQATKNAGTATTGSAQAGVSAQFGGFNF